MKDTFDSPWKESLDHFFPQFLALLFPEAYAGIDWNEPWEPLDSELRQIFPDAEQSERRADLIVRVRRKDGRDQLILIHVEVQGERDADFPRRMFIYHYRAYDRFDLPVVSLAVLGDQVASWRPDEYEHGLWGCRLNLRFPAVKLIDYNDRWEELEKSQNPFALVVMAHLQTKATRKDPGERRRSKLRLVRLLYERGYGRDGVVELLKILDWMLKLPDLEEALFREDLHRLEEELQMTYVTSFERLAKQEGIQLGRREGIQLGRQEGLQEGVQKGRQEGRQEGEKLLLSRLLAKRFGPLSDDFEKRLLDATTEQREAWAERVLDASTLDEVFDDSAER